MDEQSIFVAALEREDPARRAAFLDEACAGAPELRQRVEKLLRLHERTSTFMEEPAAPVAATTDVAVDKAGRVISHYRVDERVGAGGMGEVYRAYDLALGRDCALKVLRSGFPSHLRDRLLREAETCARLQHPGIATFFEAGEAEGEAFIAMEYVVGQTLRERLGQGPLPVDAAMTMTARLLEALGHAHALGILHRDIKPENVMLTDGSMKLLDFGIAKDVGPLPDVDRPTLTSLTEDGAIVGTVGYMSPEQLRGEPLDARSDLFSVGAVLYETLAGRPAFPGATPAERIAAILSKDPPPLAGPGIPAQINAVLFRALDRDRASRYESASAFMRDLGRGGSGEMAAPLLDSLAVLDFDNLSRGAEDDWIGAAMAESLTSDLSRLPGLDVPPRQKILGAKAARQAAGAPTDPQSLGLALGCRWLVSGTFQTTGEALRLTVRLTEVLTNHDVLTEKVDGSTEALFDVQDRLADMVGQRLNRSAPSPQRQTAPAPKLTAYECYVKGRQAWLRAEKGSLQQARELFEQAVDLEPTYAPALTGLATVNALGYNFTTDAALLDVAVDYARRAISADPENPEPHVWLGYVLGTRGHVMDAYEEQRRALELSPKDPYVLYFTAGTLLMPCSRHVAEKLCEQTAGEKGASDPHRRRREEALHLFQQALDVAPQFGAVWLGAGVTHMELGSFRESCWCLEKAIRVEKTPQCITVGAEGCLGEALRRAGKLAEARDRCLAGIETVERSDHMFRDTFRGAFLCSLGRTALQQRDVPAARTAFNQAVQHLRGRSRARGGGHLYVQALCGWSKTDEDEALFEEALGVFRRRQGFNFDFMFGCTDDATLLELARAARSLGRNEMARQLLSEAIEFGSLEALSEEMA